MAPDPRLNTHTGRICNHMNVDHVHTVLAMARMQWPEATQASLTEVTEQHAKLIAARGKERRNLTFVFEPPAKDMMEARTRLTELHHRSFMPTFHIPLAALQVALVLCLFVVIVFPAVGPFLTLQRVVHEAVGGEANVYFVAKVLAAAQAAFCVITFHWTYNVLRLDRGGVVGWQVVTWIVGAGATKKLSELIHAEDLLGESPYCCT